MAINKWFSSKTAIILAGLVLTAYLVLILAVTNLGQQRLQESQYNELQLKVTNYADTLSFFFEVNQDNIDNIATDKTMSTFFANLASGMSMEYGLGSSLFNLKKLINNLVRSSKINDISIYERIILIDFNKRLIVDTNPGTALNVNLIPFAEMEKTPPSSTEYASTIGVDPKMARIIAVNSPDGLKIKILKTVYYQNKPSAILIAEINSNLLIQQLISQKQSNSDSHIQLSTPIGDIQGWNSLAAASSEFSPISRYELNNKNIYIESPIRSTAFSLEGWFEPVNEQDIFTSGWFVLGISILAFPVLMGLYYLMRINNANIVLHTQVELSAKQQATLADQNAQLQAEIAKRKQSEKELVHQANHDSLTELPNRSYSQNRLTRAINRSKIDNTQILIMFIDLDNFKQINDTLGHDAGDQILKQTSERLVRSVRDTDTVARLGGDEFLLIIPKIANEESAKNLAGKILASFDQPFKIDNQEFFTSTSIGMSIYPQDGDTSDNLLKNADTALYRVKEAGRNGFSFYDPSMNHDVQRNLLLNSRLRQAISNNELVLYYQPIIDLKTRKIIAAEALMRWHDEELGFISPEEFIPLAEKNGLIHIIGERALEQACTEAAEWQSIAPIQIAVNFSCVQFRYCDELLIKIRETLKKTGLPAVKLEMEVTESLLINQHDGLMNMLQELKAEGVQLSIDDFGTGYSALSYLQKFSFSTLKIDRAFISKMATNQADMSLVTAILAMAKALKLKVIAEGIETDWQADFLEQRGCEYGQGYLFSRPIPAADFKQLLLKDNQCKPHKS
ncbi:MAG: diguanylate cyclase (GGDEF)-like protein [Psychromonas sp.]|jgi:diguanylate cyclase (GGDEF)-like protein|uniref:putative bifunctional diguanylate cyclase/phosphodiesterase n=1 Tax=Psychromonas sp. TaxID=1884585 RepID=UPI0039E5A74C